MNLSKHSTLIAIVTSAVISAAVSSVIILLVLNRGNESKEAPAQQICDTLAVAAVQSTIEEPQEDVEVFDLVVGTYSDDIDTQLSDLRAQGYSKAFTVPVKDDKGNQLYRLIVERAHTREEAETVQKTLKNHQITAWIWKHQAGSTDVISSIKRPAYTDLRIFELKGKVKSLSLSDDYYIFFFNRNGKLESCKVWHSTLEDYQTGLGCERDKQGNIINLVLPPTWNIGDDELSYTWSDDGFPTKEISIPSEGCETVSFFTYDKKTCCLTKKIEAVDAGDAENVKLGQNDKLINYDDEPRVYTYQVLRTDSHGNWTKRIKKSRESSETEERKIAYYE